MKLAEYLFRRLRRMGLGAMHGVPGDYNLTLLDHVKPAGLTWVGSANELNAAYAADGYARIKGLGALVTTFGVGELSAINGIAGAYAERSPVVHIVGIPSRASQDGRLLIHHTFNDGEYGRFAQMSAHVTVAQERLRDPRIAPRQINRVLEQCLLHSRPVYLEFPVDLVDAPVPDEALDEPLATPTEQPAQLVQDALERVLERMYSARKPMILVDGETRPMGVVAEVQTLVEATKWPTWTTCFGKGLLPDETVPNFHSVAYGMFDKPEVQAFSGDVDLVLCFGAHFSATNTFLYSTVPKTEKTIFFSDTEVSIDGELIRDIPAKQIMALLLEKLEAPRLQTAVDQYAPALPYYDVLPFSEAPADEPVAQDRFWRLAGNFIRPGDIVMGETGTAGYGVREMPLPRNCRLFNPVTWLSIGYMLPAAQGAALAQRELSDFKDARTILFIGDGSFQMTAQELGTIIRHNLDVVVFLLNNAGYTIERCIHGKDQEYNGVTPWRYLQAPGFFGAPEDTYTATVRTYADLEKVMSDPKLTDGRGLRMVEVMLERDDAPRGPLREMMQRQGS